MQVRYPRGNYRQPQKKARRCTIANTLASADATLCFATPCDMGLEWIVSKRADSVLADQCLIW